MWIKGFENRYEITKDGKVFFHKDNVRTERKLVPDKNGYMTINIKKDGKVFCKKIHREVGKTYINSFDGEHINHINGIKSDNRVENLEWCTNFENMKHMRELGLKKVGYKYENNTTGFYGVMYQNNKYQARLKRGRKDIYLGSFDTPQSAFDIVQKSLYDESMGLKIKSYILNKKIFQMDLDNNIINIYKSISEAEKQTGIANQTIGKAILGKLKHAGGFKWKREEIQEYI